MSNSTQNSKQSNKSEPEKTVAKPQPLRPTRICDSAYDGNVVKRNNEPKK
ncbi:MAG: hypothetical protein ABH890_07645 [Bacillota bacterium]